jgi:transposase-like protein
MEAVGAAKPRDEEVRDGEVSGLYFRFCLRYCDVEELLFARRVIVTYEAIRKWCLKLGVWEQWNSYGKLSITVLMESL